MKFKIPVFTLCLFFSFEVLATELECMNVQTRIQEFKERCQFYHDTGMSSYGYDQLMYRNYYYNEDNIFSITCYSTHINSSATTVQESSGILPLTCFPGSVVLKSGTPENPKPIVQCGSIIQSSNQVVGEAIPLTGSSFKLWYFSSRVVGKKSDYTTVVRVTPDYVRPTVINYSLLIKNEGDTTGVTQNFLPLPSLTYQYEWNGLDVGLNETWGPIKSTISAHENAPDNLIEDISTTVFLGNLKAKKLGLGGWFPSVWHFYHAPSQTLYQGDGNFRKVAGVIDGSYTRIAEESGREVYYFDSTGKIVFTKLGLTGTTIYSFSYDSSGRLLSITEPFSKVTSFNRWSNGNIQEIVAPNGKVTSLSLDINGYLSEVVNPISESYNMSYYGTGGLLHTFTVPSGDITTLTYDTLGNLIGDSHSNGSSTTLLKTPTSVLLTSSLGRETSHTYNVNSNLETKTKPSGYQLSVANHEGYTETINPDLYETTYFSSHPRFGAQSRILSSIESYNFGQRASSFSNATTLTIPENPFSIDTIVDVETIGPSVNTATYTGSNRTMITSSKLGKTSKVQIDQYERPILTQTGSLTSKIFTYTNELLTKIAQGTREEVLTYSTSGLLSSVTNSLGQVTSYTYDNAERLKTTTLPDLRVINYNYDYNGNLTSITPPYRNEHKLIYGINDKIVTYQPPLLSGVINVDTEYAYNDDKQLVKITRPDGEEIDFNYDSITGLLNSIEGTFGIITKSYNSEKPDTIVDQYGHRLSMNYTRAVASNVYFSKDEVGIYNYSRTPYNPVGGKVESETIDGLGGSSVQRIVNYIYNDDEDLTTAGALQLAYNYPNGQLTGTTLSNVKDYYTYNSFGEISTYQVKYLTNVIYEYTLTRDAIGRVSQKIEKLNSVTKTFDYGYDTAGRLVEVKTNGVVTSTYSYDGNSNRTGGVIRGESTSATYDGQDRLTSYNSIAHTYNANGEMLTKGTANFNYDVFGNLKTYVKGTTSVTYEIDPLQRRFGTIVGTTLSSRFVYNPEGQVVGQLNNLNKLQKTFVYASKRHVPDYYIDASNNKFKIVTDYLGSVRLVVSTSGVVSEIMEHDEFGRVLQDTNPGVIPFGFAGGLYDHRTGFVRFGVRDYDPEIGRWLSKDPIRFDGKDTNLYGYVLQDPINLIDPDGKFFREVVNWVIDKVYDKIVDFVDDMFKEEKPKNSCQ